MAIYGTPEPKTSVGGVFSSQLSALQGHNTTEEQAIITAGAPQWYRPDGWDESWLNIPSFHSPFLRTQQEDEFIQATTDPQSPGTASGDTTMVSVQGDFLHVMERAFRARMFNPVRSRVQCAGRKMGHAHGSGVIKEGLLGYIVNVDRLNKGEKV
jgi:hypothetical protein